jgi:hypothetical protein
VVSPVDPRTGNDVYLRVDDGPYTRSIVRYNLDTLTYQPTGWAPNIVAGDFAWVDMADPDFPGLSLAVTYYNAQLVLGSDGNLYYRSGASLFRYRLS